MRRLIGFVIAAAGVSIMFLPVSTNHFGHEACGSGWHAVFNSSNNLDYECGEAALPRLWIAGAVVAVGMGIAFWGASRRRLLVMVGLAVVVTVLITVAGLSGANSMGGE